MDISIDLLANALVAGLLLGGFYAAVTIGVSISFGILDIVNIAHPAFIILGSYIAYMLNSRLGIDPIVASIIMLPAFYALGGLVYQIYHAAFERHGQESLRGLAFFFGLLFITEVILILAFGVDYRYVAAPYIGPSLHWGVVDLPLRMLVPCLVSLSMFIGLQIFLSGTFVGRAIMAVAQDQFALQLMGCSTGPDQTHRVRALDRHRLDRGGAAHRHSAGRAFGRARIYRPRLRHLRPRRARQPSGHAARRHAGRDRREPHLDVLRTLVGAGGRVRLPAVDPRGATGRLFGR